MELDEKFLDLISEKGYIKFDVGEYKVKHKSKGFLVKFKDDIPIEIITEKETRKKIILEKKLTKQKTFSYKDKHYSITSLSSNENLTEMLNEGQWKEAFIVPNHFDVIVLGYSSLISIFGKENILDLKDLVNYQQLREENLPKTVESLSKSLFLMDFKKDNHDLEKSKEILRLFIQNKNERKMIAITDRFNL